MSAREDVERLLAEHERILGGPSNLPVCSCGTAVPQRTGLLPWHRAHAARVLDEAGLLGGAQALRDARDALYRGEGPDLVADSDIVYGEWLGNRADRETRP